MIAGKLRFILFFLIALLMGLNLQAQEEKKISFNCFSGIALLPFEEKLNEAGQPTNIFGKYPPAITFGAGVNYKFNDRYLLSNNLFFFFTSKSNYSFSASGLRTSLKFFPIKDFRKFSPYISAGLNLNLVNINRKKYSQEFIPDSTANVIGSGIGVSKITYNYDPLKLSFVPMPGASIGAGLALRLSDKVSIFVDYTYNYNLANLSSLMKDNYFYNKSNLNYHFATAGVTIKLLKPVKQMLATLHKSDWDGDPTITIRGTLIYKKEKKSNDKVIPVEMTDVRDTVLAIIPTEKSGAFEYKNLRPEDYKFMLAKRNKKILRADIQVIHDNTSISIFEEYPELEMIEDFTSNNIITRDNNFSVILREGFQHEVDITVIANNVIGKVKPISYDTLCRNLLVLLKNKQDSTIAVTEPSEDCLFNFPDVEPGQHKVVFVRKDIIGKEAKFSYSFEENPPVIRKQYNTEEDTANYELYSMVEIPEENTMNMEEILLSRRYEQKVNIEESFISLNSSVIKNKEILQENNSADNKSDKMKDGIDEKKDEEAKNNDKMNQGELVEVDIKEKVNAVETVDTVVKVVNNEMKVETEKMEEKVSAGESGDTLVAGMNIEKKDEGQKEVAKIEENIGSKEGENKIIGESIEIVNDKMDDSEKLLENSMKEKKLYSLPEMLPRHTYSVQGEEQDLKGYGVQVGAFKSDDHAQKFCEKFTKRRTEPMFIQVVSQDENSYHAKLYRVIVGDYPDIETATKEAAILKKAGYDTVLRRHLKPSKSRN